MMLADSVRLLIKRTSTLLPRGAGPGAPNIHTGVTVALIIITLMTVVVIWGR